MKQVYISDARARLAANAAIMAPLLFIMTGGAHADNVSVAEEPVPTPAPDAQTKVANAISLDEIIVTAQKRSQNLNDVGMSITAIGASEIADRGVERPEDLARVVPSLTVVKTQYDVPSYTLRGVGFYDSSLAAPPTISLYVDQVPLAYPIMARGAPLDLERIEVLKGPQGTVFGQNSTGGLINFIAAKPTDVFSAGSQVGYSRFGLFDGDVFVSGPITAGISARLSVATSQGGAWQESATRADDHLGDQRFTRARLIVDAEPVDTLRLSFNVNGWFDRSDTQAAETIDDVAHVNGEPVNPVLDISRNIQKPRADDPRTADWDAGSKFRRDDDFIQTSLRADLDILSNVTLTSISEYSHLGRNSLNDGDGTPALNVVDREIGDISDFSQELRLSGPAFDKRLNWSAGANYQHDNIDDYDEFLINADAGGFLLPGIGAFTNGEANAFTHINSLAEFANADFDLRRNVTITGGVRYTENRTHYRGCTSDAGEGDLAAVIGTIQQFALGVPVTTAPGQCVTLRDDSSTPPADLFSSGYFVDTLKQHNLSWRGGINWKPWEDETLLYANVSRGFKAGSFPRTAANLTSQLEPVTQEKLTAYEVGFKMPLANNTLQLNGAAFYYDYRDKQIRGRVVTIFGQLEELLNIPRSRIWGLESQVVWRPIAGWTMSGSATYVNSKILQNPDGSDFATYPSRQHNDDASIPITGSVFPFTPAYSATVDTQYEWALASNYVGFVGSSATYQSRSKSTLTSADPSKPTDISVSATTTFNDPTFSINPYAIVDLRAGVKSQDGRWMLTVWGRNILDKYYNTNITLVQDTIARYNGMPATFGFTIGWRM